MLGKPKARCFCIVHPESEQCQDISFSQTSIQVKLPCVGEEGPRGQQAEDVLRDFAFDRVFGPGCPGSGQARIFQEVAQPAVQDAVERLESCCFVALGCSGHGKTFAVTGGPRRFEDRGLVPRAISCLFELLNAKTNREDFQVKVSFFELYRDSFLDLLSKRAPVNSRVGQSQKDRMPCPMERPAAQAAQAACVSCVNESEAYQRLFEGDARRHFERLPRNPETSRGHVFFQLHLKKQSETKEAVLSFVDLAAGAQGAQCPRNQATESIESSLQELRQLARSALCGGLPEPLPEPGLLCSLLLPWLRPGGLSLPSLVTLLPLRWQKQSGSEIYDFLQLVRILHQAAKSRSPQRNGAGPPIPRSPQSQEEASREADTANSPSDALTTWSPWSAVVVHSQKAEEALEAEEPAEAEVGPRPVPMKSELPDPPPLGPRPTGLDPLGQLLGRLPTPLRWCLGLGRKHSHPKALSDHAAETSVSDCNFAKNDASCTSTLRRRLLAAWRLRATRPVHGAVRCVQVSKSLADGRRSATAATELRHLEGRGFQGRGIRHLALGLLLRERLRRTGRLLRSRPSLSASPCRFRWPTRATLPAPLCRRIRRCRCEDTRGPWGLLVGVVAAVLPALVLVPVLPHYRFTGQGLCPGSLWWRGLGSRQAPRLPAP
ncbi:Kinesin-like protein KIF6 [Symbiodinium microadriaticum]|uniref:Kinesin-like protein KIF6 n=1 Tax=Symbiodinium microadriaticum TaxID=2951 RepID=A0A1Q9C687_SYMMI|nr:Kinesin-like protein KIF6 [Symbiodinium microadriaticum]